MSAVPPEQPMPSPAEVRQNLDAQKKAEDETCCQKNCNCSKYCPALSDFS